MMLRAFDWILVLVLLVLAWRTPNDRDLFRAAIKFIAFGLLIAVAWLRLRAPDVALAEAAVGSGLTGALILSALVRMRRREREARNPKAQGRQKADVRSPKSEDRNLGRTVPYSAFGLRISGLGLLAALSWAALSLPEAPSGLTEAALAQLPASGVNNPVTAALLNYRGYDTLLEIGVLLLAILSVWALRRGQWRAGELRDRPLLLSLLRLLLPVLGLAAGHLLWIGAFAPGGAFQGGALLGGALVLVMLGGLARRVLHREALVRAGLALGVLVFAAICAITMALTGGLLQYPPGSAGAWITVIESAALISVGLTLGLLYLGGRPTEEE